MHTAFTQSATWQVSYMMHHINIYPFVIKTIAAVWNVGDRQASSCSGGDRHHSVMDTWHSVGCCLWHCLLSHLQGENIIESKHALNLLQAEHGAAEFT